MPKGAQRSYGRAPTAKHAAVYVYVPGMSASRSQKMRFSAQKCVTSQREQSLCRAAAERGEVSFAVQ